MLEFSQEIAGLLSQYVIPLELFKGLMYYIVERGNTSDASQFLHQIAEKADDYLEVVMTIVEQLRREGIQKGKHEAQLGIARQMLESSMDRQTVMKFTGLTDSELKKLFKD